MMKMPPLTVLLLYTTGGGGEIPWCFSQVKGTIEDEVADGKGTPMYSPNPVPFSKQVKSGLLVTAV